MCKIFVLNLLVAAIVEAHAAGSSQFEAMLLSARCGDAVGLASADRKADASPATALADLRSNQSPANQSPANQYPGGSHSCPLCATACPLGGCAPVDAGSLDVSMAAPLPRDFPGIGSFLHLVSAKPARLLSDAAAQAPPASTGSFFPKISEQS